MLRSSENKLRTFIIPHCCLRLNAGKENKILESNITPRPENEGSQWTRVVCVVHNIV